MPEPDRIRNSRFEILKNQGKEIAEVEEGKADKLDNVLKKAPTPIACRWATATSSAPAQHGQLHRGGGIKKLRREGRSFLFSI